MISLGNLRSTIKLFEWITKKNVISLGTWTLKVIKRMSNSGKSYFVKKYASASTKTTCIINEALAPYFKASLLEAMKNEPYSLTVDGSNDNGLQKMNPLTVQILISRRDV